MVTLRVAPAAARAGSPRSAVAAPATDVRPRAPPTTSERRDTFFRGHLTTLSAITSPSTCERGRDRVWGLQKSERCPPCGHAFLGGSHDFRRMRAIYVSH